MARLTIHDIKRIHEEKDPDYFFDSKTMKFFGQTLRSFSVQKIDEENYLISAPMKERSTGKKVGITARKFNTVTGKLELPE